MEYELDDIAAKTKQAQNLNRIIRKKSKDEIILVVKSNEYSKSLIDELKQQYPNAKDHTVYISNYSLEELKPYNVKEQLVYANKIEHFLLHYLIDSIRGQTVFSGGPNYLCRPRRLWI